MENNNNQNPAPNTQPAENGAQNGGRLFTQEDVNRIISERLAKERTKSDPAPEDKITTQLREQETRLNERENTLRCREYLSEKGYPAALLEILNPADADKFIGSVEKLLAAFPDISPTERGKTPVFVSGTSKDNGGASAFAEAFKPKI